MRRSLSIILALIVCLAVFPTMALASEGDFVIENGVLVAYNGSGGKVIIPDGVTAVGDLAFFECDTLTTVYIPEGVTQIGAWAFRGCHELKSVVFPDSVTEIGFSAFESCDALTALSLPNHLTSIGLDAFSGCTALSTIIIPESVASVGIGAFHNCSGLDTITIPGGMLEISNFCFEGCTNLRTATILDGVNRINYSAFAGCDKLTTITIPNSVAWIGERAFDGCPNLSDVYYAGTSNQWSSIMTEVTMGVVFDEDGMPMEESTNLPISETNLFGTAAIHYNSAPSTIEISDPISIINTGLQPQKAGTTQESSIALNLDGNIISISAYKLVEESGSTNYIRLRDLATLLNGTAAQFDVTWDGAVNIVTHHSYENPNGTEGGTPFTGDQNYTAFDGVTKVNGIAADLAAFTITYQGGGHTYYQLRDLGRALGFNVGWSKDRGVFLETDKAYTDAD